MATELARDVAAVVEELKASGLEDGPALQAYAGQIARLREAQHRIDDEGLVVADARGNPIPHPALAIERAAQNEIREWAKTMRPPRARGRGR